MKLRYINSLLTLTCALEPLTYYYTCQFLTPPKYNVILTTLGTTHQCYITKLMATRLPLSALKIVTYRLIFGMELRVSAQ